MTEEKATHVLDEILASCAWRVEEDLNRWTVEEGTPRELAEAMTYCVMGGGKRLRPALTFLAAEAAGGNADDELTRRAAVSVELIHTYSLVHDDLPSMDDDMLRRGQPTAHVRFGEAMAVLVGDALLTRAFAVLAEADDPRVLTLTAELARGAGPAGMIAGQVADMDLCRLPEGQEAIHYIHLRKTAALMRAAVRMGAITGGADAASLQSFSDYAESLGLAFQVVDDVLDVTGRADEIGKTPGKDVQAGKKTSVAHLGLEGARRLSRRLTASAVAALAPLGRRARPLQMLAEWLGRRSR